MTVAANHRDRLYRAASARGVPIEVMIELTQRCNLRCRHCYIDDFTVPDRLTTERVRALLAELADLGTLVVGFSGGEILTRPDCLELAASARELGFELHLLTNAILVDDRLASALAPLHPRVHVSYYSRDPAAFDTIAGTAGTFARVTAGVERLRSRGVEVILKMPLMKHNLGHVAAVRAWADSVGAECRTAPVLFPRRDGGRAPLELRASPAEWLPQIGGPETGCDPGQTTGGDDPPLCAAGTRYAVVTAGGDVFPCNVLPLVAGNVLETSFREVWERAELFHRLRALRRRDLTVCGGCGAFPVCGRCHTEALLEDGDMLGPSSAACGRAAALGALDERGA